MVWRVIGFVLNPLVALLWWSTKSLGGAFDRRLGPTIGLWFALALLALTVMNVVSGAISIAPLAGRYVGLVEPEQIKVFPGQVIAVEFSEKTKYTVRQALRITYKIGDETQQFVEVVTRTTGTQLAPGEPITVYLRGGHPPTVDDPEDGFKTAFEVIVKLAFPLFLAFFAWRYMRHRRRIHAARLPPAPIQPQGVKLAGSDKVLSTAERMKADEDSIRRAKAGQP